jgi:hypothetical protein
MLQLDLRISLRQLFELSRARWSSLVSTYLQQPTEVNILVLTPLQ